MDNKLKKLWISEFSGRIELRIDWENDRHQAIELRGNRPEDIKNMLELALLVIKSEIHEGEI